MIADKGAQGLLQKARPYKKNPLLQPYVCPVCVWFQLVLKKMNPSENDRDRQGNGFTKCEEVLDAYLH